MNLFAKHGVFLSFLFLCLAGGCPQSLWAQQKRALLIGISNYASNPDTGWENLHAANDVRLLAATLQAQQFTDLTLLVDQQATHQHILEEIQALARRTQPGDTLVFHFSGHGQPFEDLDGDEGTQDGWDESLVPYDAPMLYSPGQYEGEHHITDDQLYQYLLQLRKKAGKKGSVVALIDACYAGSGMRGDEDESPSQEPITHRPIVGFCITGYKPFTPARNRQSFRQLPTLPDHAPLIAIEAGLPHQKSREIKVGDTFYGPLSYYVARSLQQYPFSSGTQWVKHTRSLFRTDKRLYKQTLYVEATFPIVF